STGQGFLLMGVGALVVTLFAVVSLLGTLAGLARGRGIVGRRLGYVVVGALPAALVLATVGVAGFQAPPIHDITTDFADPPVFVFAAEDRGPGDNPVAYSGGEHRSPAAPLPGYRAPCVAGGAGSGPGPGPVGDGGVRLAGARQRHRRR